MRDWTDDILAKLGEMRRRGKTYSEIAVVLDRSHDAVKNAAARYGFAQKHKPGRAYNRGGRPHAHRAQWGYIPSHGMNRDALFIGCRFEDDPRACRPEPRWRPRSPGLLNRRMAHQGSEVMRRKPTVAPLPSEAR